MEMKAIALEEPATLVRALTGSILGCGGWVLSSGAITDVLASWKGIPKWRILALVNSNRQPFFSQYSDRKDTLRALKDEALLSPCPADTQIVVGAVHDRGH